MAKFRQMSQEQMSTFQDLPSIPVLVATQNFGFTFTVIPSDTGVIESEYPQLQQRW